MRTIQCGVCLRYRGDLQCDAFPRGIPEEILTGQADHSEPYEGDEGIRFKKMPYPVLAMSKSEQEQTDLEGAALIHHVNQVVEREDVAYRRVKSALQRKGYMEADFEEGGPLYGYSVNELLDLVRSKEGDHA